MAFTPLNALNAFLAVARRRSFAAAARDLGVSNSALSQAVRQLEARVGTALLTRTSRSVALTEAGQRLLEHAGPAVEQALDALKTINARPGEVTGRVRLSAPNAAVPLILKRLVPAFIDRFPRVDLDIQVDNRFVNIVSEGFDAGIRLIEAIDRDMVQVRLTGPCRVVVAGAPSYLKRKGVPETPTDLLKHDCLCFRRTPNDEPRPWEFERGKKTWRVPVRGPVTVSDPELIHALALGGHGLLYTLDAVIATPLERGRLRVVLERYAPNVPGLFLYFPSRAQVSPALRAFVDVAREIANVAAPTTR
ncbi:MAG TPA: LysR substrate-binding domain-containing protein [Candidatus Binatia bacterium]|nr:LysR substrate-binding domain-containing protein [Candidatus Binatia bacterium]